MKYCTSVLLVTLVVIRLNAQQRDSLYFITKTDSFKTVNSGKTKSDTLVEKVQNKLKTAHSAESKLISFSLERALIKALSVPAKKDTARHEPLPKDSSRVAQHNSIPKKHFPQNTDSLKRVAANNLNKLNHISMSPTTIKLPDSVRHSLDSIKNKLPLKDVKAAEQKVAQLQTGVNSKITGAENAVNNKLNAFNKAGGNAGTVNVPGLNEKLPGVGNTTIPGVSTNIPNASINTSSIENLNVPSVSLPKNEIGELNSVEKETGSLSKLTGEAGRYGKDVQSIGSGDIGNNQQLSKDLESKAAGMEGMGDLQKESAQLEQYKKMQEQWNNDPEYRQELVLNKAKEQAINHFAGYEQQLQGAMNKLSSAKAKIGDAEQMVSAFGRKENPMKEKSFMERVRPGVTIQIQKKQNVWLDINPQIAYSVAAKWMAGIGWNERWSFNYKRKNFYAPDRIYGYRSFVQFKLKEGSYVMATAERMNAFVPLNITLPETRTRQWVWSYMVGLKKEFKFSKKVLGNVQMLYNLFDHHHKSPYADRLNVRMGFEFPVKKKVAKVS